MQSRKFDLQRDVFCQGSIFSLKKLQFITHKNTMASFTTFYPEADIDQVDLAVLCTQDCDIQQKKVTHLNIALLEPIQRLKKENPLRFLDLKFNDLVEHFEGMNFYTLEALNRLKTSIEDLVDNNSSHFMFVNIDDKYHYINLTKVFPLKFDHFLALREQAKYQLDGAFKYLLGWKLAYMYGRVGVDLYKENQKDEIVRKILKSIGQSVKFLWPENSYELTNEQYQTLKSDLSNYKAQMKQNKRPEKLIKRIFYILEQYKLVTKKEKT